LKKGISKAEIRCHEGGNSAAANAAIGAWSQVQRLPSLSITIAAILIASESSASPTLMLSTPSIALSPTETMITITVDPNGTPLSALVLNFSGLATELTILDPVTPIEPGIEASGPTLLGDVWLADFAGAFLSDRTLPFEVGTLILEGFVPGGLLVLEGNYTDASFVDFPILPMSVAHVVPEPESTASVAACMFVLACLLRRRAK
jgi:hypothetical protein